VNPEWHYNAIDWKAHLYPWDEITNFDQWRKAVKSDLDTDMSKWNDKIWLMHWFQMNQIAGPEILYWKYSDSEWHSKQPFRWGDARFGKSAPMSDQQAYISAPKSSTGIDWDGIKYLNSNIPTLKANLQREPSPLMNSLQHLCQEGNNRNQPGLAGKFVVKASHMSESQGVFLVSKGKLITNVRYDEMSKITFTDEKTLIFAKFRHVKTLFEKYQKGAAVCKDLETLAEVQILMQFQEMIWVAWESARSKIIPRGTLIEKLRNVDLEIKVSTGMGRAWGHYYNSWSAPSRLTDHGTNLAYELAEATAAKAGVDFCRVDIVLGQDGLIVSELTLVPGYPNDYTKAPVLKHLDKLIRWHQYYRALLDDTLKLHRATGKSLGKRK
jgi:hypothetical protein